MANNSESKDENERVQINSPLLCSMSECNNEAKSGIGWGLSKGTIPLCAGCVLTYMEHCKARDKYMEGSLK